MEEFSRTELLIKKEGLEKLQNSSVAVFGVGGVDGFVIEALVRAGIGTIHIVDHDTVSISNLNRQIIATHQTIDRKKVDVMKERILSINPYCNVKIYDDFFLPETANHFPFDEFDYIVDAVDTVTAKIKLVEISQEKKIPIISSMGTGNKLDYSRRVLNNLRLIDTWSDNQRFVDGSLQLRYIDSADPWIDKGSAMDLPWHFPQPWRCWPL